jgi:hypothetical protein
MGKQPVSPEGRRLGSPVAQLLCQPLLQQRDWWCIDAIQRITIWRCTPICKEEERGPEYPGVTIRPQVMSSGVKSATSTRRAVGAPLNFSVPITPRFKLADRCETTFTSCQIMK